jgi:energy-converting hydrogenase Eha subunit C
MNSTEAKKINFIEFIVRICNDKDIVNIQTNTALFKHPLRTDKQASLSIFINRENGNWSYKDFALNETGNIIDFVIRNYNDVTDVSSALKKICEILNITQEKKYIPIEFEHKKTTNKNIEIKTIKELNNRALIDYLSERKINISIAKKYLKEIYFSIQKDDELKNYFGLCFENRNSGYEVRNKYIKNNLVSKDITVFYTGDKPSQRVLFFEGFMDFLSALTFYNTFVSKYDVIVLNSTSQINKAIKLIIKNKYSVIYDYLDNDFAGQLCQITLINELENAFKRKEIDYNPKIINSFSIYQSYKDFNDFLIYS